MPLLCGVDLSFIYLYVVFVHIFMLNRPSLRYETSICLFFSDVLSFEGFLHYILSEENVIISMDLLDLSHEMDKPLSNYFINSSHNTYLIGEWVTNQPLKSLF